MTGRRSKRERKGRREREWGREREGKEGDGC